MLRSAKSIAPGYEAAQWYFISLLIHESSSNGQGSSQEPEVGLSIVVAPALLPTPGLEDDTACVLIQR